MEVAGRHIAPRSSVFNCRSTNRMEINSRGVVKHVVTKPYIRIYPILFQSYVSFTENDDRFTTLPDSTISGNQTHIDPPVRKQYFTHANR